VSTAEQFEIVIDSSQRSPVVKVRGELDVATSPKLTDALGSAFERGSARVVIDLANVTFIDSRGMSALVRAHVTATALGTRLSIRGATGNARRALEICGLLTLLEAP
jgi:anti-sigma B factor antagonist